MPPARQVISEVVTAASQNDWSLERYTCELLEREIEGRPLRRIERLSKASKLPVSKTLATFDTKRLPLPTRRMLPELSSGRF